MTQTMLFIQGGGQGTHDEWDNKLVDSLRRHLVGDFKIRYPRMPAEDDPGEATWGPAIRQQLASLENGAIVIGHSVGATILVHLLTQETPRTHLGAIVLLSAPFVGADGWPATELELPSDLGALLPKDVPIHVFHGLDDDTVPPAHANLYGRAIPQAHVHLLPGRDHQLGNDLSEVATLINALSTRVA